MKCSQIHNLFLDYFDSNLDDQQKLQLENHLAACSRCREDFEALKNYHSSLSVLPPVVPPDNMKDQIMSRLPDAGDSRHAKNRKLRHLVYYSGAAAILIMVIFLVTPDRFFDPINVNTNYIQKVEQNGKGHDKSVSPEEKITRKLNQQVNALETVLQSEDQSQLTRSNPKSSGNDTLLEIRILKSDYFECIDQIRIIFPGIEISQNKTFSISRYCHISIAIQGE